MARTFQWVFPFIHSSFTSLVWCLFILFTENTVYLIYHFTAYSVLQELSLFLHLRLSSSLCWLISLESIGRPGMQDFPLEKPRCFVDVIFILLSAESILDYNFYSLVVSQIYTSVLFRHPLELFLKTDIVFVTVSYSAKITLRIKSDIS